MKERPKIERHDGLASLQKKWSKWAEEAEQEIKELREAIVNGIELAENIGMKSTPNDNEYFDKLKVLIIGLKQALKKGNRKDSTPLDPSVFMES